VTVLFGPSGAGKTTILRAIAGILPPDSGRIELGGEIYFDSRNGIDLPIQRRRIGYVFQNHTLFPHLTAGQNVLYGAKPHDGKSPHERVRELFDQFALAGTAGRYPHELSGGEQQRVAIARALVTEPTILLADEPTGALDQTTGQQVMELFKKIHNEGRTIIMITHDIKIAENAERIVKILDGCLTEEVRADA
jgi:putative ABC transport system ATP-binding protein